MTIPKTHELYYEVLEVISDGNSHTGKEVRELVKTKLDLSPQELQILASSGPVLVDTRINWAISHLAMAEALQRPDKGCVQITKIGLDLLSNNDREITREEIQNLDGYKAWRARSVANQQARRQTQDSNEVAIEELQDDVDPKSLMQQANESLRNDVASELLDRVRTESPDFLEKLVLKLLLSMGYGASEDDLEHTGGSGDEGIDGVVRQDLLGLERIYVQAKRYREQGTIGGEAIQAFIGALSLKNATRGVFITTSRFSAAALKYVEDLRNQSVVLIDGPALVNYMIDFGVGVTPIETYTVYAVDENFFTGN